jgi:hypothetical protein
VAPGVIFGNFHFPGVQNVNNLTIAALDPLAKSPEYKVCAVRLAAVDVEAETRAVVSTAASVRESPTQALSRAASCGVGVKHSS